MTKPKNTLGVAAIPRWLHPGAWWIWALGLATAASRTTNPLLLALLVAVAGWVVSQRKPDAPWSRSYIVFLRLGLVVIAIRMMFAVILGSGAGNHVLLTLPQIPMPDWAAGVRLGGPITAEELLLALYQAMLLATMLACIGAANSLANPSRLLKSVPAALYEVGVAVVVAMTFAPQLVADVSRVRTARRLRGRPDHGVAAVAASIMPVLEGALERAVNLAAAMDSRGYGRTNAVTPRARRTSAGLLLLGLVGICVGTYGLLDGSASGALGLPVLVIGAAAATSGMVLAGRRGLRTRYRPDPWALPEWLVALSGCVPAAVFIIVSTQDPATLMGQVVPPQWPSLPILPAASVLCAMAAGLLAPRVPTPVVRNAPQVVVPQRDSVTAP